MHKPQGAPVKVFKEIKPSAITVQQLEDGMQTQAIGYLGYKLYCLGWQSVYAGVFPNPSIGYSAFFSTTVGALPKVLNGLKTIASAAICNKTLSHSLPQTRIQWVRLIHAVDW